MPTAKTNLSTTMACTLFYYGLIFLLLLSSNSHSISAQPNNGATRVAVSDDVVIEFMVIRADDSTKQQSLPAAAIEAGGILAVRMEYEGEAWLSFGSSPNGMMVGGEVVIGLPGSTQNKPTKYTMSGLGIWGINERPESEQTLLDAHIEQTDGRTVMEFAKLLNEPTDLYPMVPPSGDDSSSSKHTFIWAVGTSNALRHHVKRNQFSVDLFPVATNDEATATVELGSNTAAPNKTLWFIHGLFATLAWAVLAPLATACSLLRSYIPVAGLWLKLHLYLNLGCVLFTIVASITAFAAIKQSEKQHFYGGHGKIGICLVLLCVLQVVNGYFRPPPAAKAAPVKGGSLEETEHDNKDINRDEESNDDNLQKEEEENEHQEPSSSAKTGKRKAFEVGHRVLGAVIFAAAFFNIYSGLNLFAVWFNSSNNYTTIFWSYIGAFISIVSIATIVSKTKHSSN